MTTYLFLVTLGPIQEFIAAARRTRDLWAGSQLLSNLSREAAKWLRGKGAELIFPAQEDLERHEVANRILATLPTPPNQIGPQLEQHLRSVLRTSAQKQLEGVRGLQRAGTLNMAVDQVEELLEIFWAGVAHTASYQEDRDKVEAALAACKNTRPFAQPRFPSTQAMVPKSSIDGVRESVIPEEFFPRRGASEDERQRKIKELFELFGAGQAERLSGVDLLKRHARGPAGEADFPSTSHFAALPWLQRHSAYQSAFDTYLKNIKPLGPERLHSKRFENLSLLRSAIDRVAYDASVLFEERLGEDADPVVQRAARGSLQDLYKCIGSRPEPYYAILLADGDNMGKIIDHQASNGIPQHQAFSRDLDTFAASVRGIVESETYRGALVYAGGDDVLAFLPLDTVLPCAKKLAETFSNQLAAYKGKQGEAATLSVGIAICHHIEPLSDALDLARKAEKDVAKNLPGKNALAITVSKRSGADVTVVGSWDGHFLKRLERFIELYQADRLPDGAAFELRDLDERVGRTLPPEAQTAEALRILQRKRGGHGKVQLSEDVLALIKEALAAGEKGRRSDGRPLWGVNELADELIVARELARALGPARSLQKEP